MEFRNIIPHSRLILFACICFFSVHFKNVQAQDIQFSQFYANVLYLNPAMAGSSHGIRGILHQRLQWPALDARYITSLFSGDYYFEGTGSGVGIMFMRDWQGPNHLKTSEFSAQFSQEINLAPQISARAGIQAGYVSRYVDFSRLSFPDQFTDNGYSGPNTAESFAGNRISFFDLGLGGLIYGDYYWFGVSAHHVNTPDNSFYDDGTRLPAKFAFVAGYKFELRDRRSRSSLIPDREFYVTPTIHYKLQGKSDQFDAGLYAVYNNLIAGAWYRGIPILKHYRNGLHNNESMVLLAGYKYRTLSIAYSFDFTVSKLATARTLGAHEINLTYIHRPGPKKKKKFRRLPCPNFYK